MSARIVAVTGASRGIGAAIALELARRGFVVGCLSRKGQGIETSDVPAGLCAQMESIACDVDDERSIAAAFETLVQRRGRIDALVNNAGIHRTARSSEMASDEYDAVMNTNARAVFVACREVYRHLAAHGGTIINIGSFFDKMGVKGNLAYCASKAAVGAITRCLAVEWASKNIRVLDVAPGYIETELNADAMQGSLREFLQARIPGKRPGRPDEVARLVGALIADDIPFLTGETIYIDGAQAIAH
jgi:NAD(P)-dependent dehydrogenase (short-subunit alcohol dehydrogenase family)